MRYPQLRINLAHFGFPWVLETAAIILKYPNVYADTACCYMDCPEQFFEQLFFKLMGPLWVEHNLADKILFGSQQSTFPPGAHQAWAGISALLERDYGEDPG